MALWNYGESEGLGPRTEGDALTDGKRKKYKTRKEREHIRGCVVYETGGLPLH